MKKMKRFTAIPLAVILALVLSVSAFATGFNAGIVVTRENDKITVEIEESSVLNDKKPRLSIPADEAFAEAVVFLDGSAETVVYADGMVTFTVYKGGHYYIVAEAELIDSVAATCTQTGKNEYHFDGDTYVEIVPAQGHDFTDTTRPTCANCTEPNPNYVSPNTPPTVKPTPTPTPNPRPNPKPETPEVPSVDPDDPVVGTTVTENEDGSITKTETLENSTKATTNVSAEGTVTVEAEIPAEVAQSGEVVTLPVSNVTASKDSKAAAVLTITTNNTEDTKVEIPVENVTTGTVVVMIDADGSETVLSTTKLTENGVVADLPNGATVKVVDNSKDFGDISDNAWYKDAVDYVSARGIVTGMTEDSYDYDGITTRAQLWTILARMDGVDTEVGDGKWYEIAQQWAIENGVSDGSNPNAEITREQLVTMLWRYAGEPESDHDISGFEDYHETSDWAYAAKQWANENGVVNGSGNKLNPQGETTRAQLAQFIMNFMENVK